MTSVTVPAADTVYFVVDISALPDWAGSFALLKAKVDAGAAFLFAAATFVGGAV